MTKFVSISAQPKGGVAPTEKYVKQTYDALTHTDINLERVAMQIAQLPVREQRKFFRLLLNYLDITSNIGNYSVTSVTMADMIELSTRLIDVVNDYYFEQDQLAFEGM